MFSESLLQSDVRELVKIPWNARFRRLNDGLRGNQNVIAGKPTCFLVAVS